MTNSIDTDKYEGHEPAPWEYCPDSECILGSQNEETGNWPILVELPEQAFFVEGEWMVQKRLPNAKSLWVKLDDYDKSVWWGDRLSVLHASHKLMADAPLLLEEVKRLQEQLAKANKYVHTICQHSDSMLMDYEDYMKGDEQE